MSVEGISWFYVFYIYYFEIGLTNTHSAYQESAIHFFYKICNRSEMLKNTHMSVSRGTPGKTTNVKWCDMNRVLFLRVSFSIITPPSSHVYDTCIVKKCALKSVQVQNLFICFYFIIMHSWFKLDVTELVFPYTHFMRCVIFKMDLRIACWDLRVDFITCVTGEYTHHLCLEGVIWFILLTSFKEFCVSYFFILLNEWVECK